MAAEEQMLKKCWAELYGSDHDDLLTSFLAELDEHKARQTEQVKDPQWYKEAVVYSLYVDLFNTDFPGLIEKLDYLSNLGVTCLWLLPILDSPMKDVGFDIRRYDRVREELLGLPEGSTDEEQVAAFRSFLDEAHNRGLRVIFDIALNHTSEEHEWFVDAKKSKDNPYRDYYVWSDTTELYKEARLLFKGLCPSNWEKCGDQYFFHRFYEFQPDLNYRNPNVLVGMSRHLLFWLGQGVDGFRADAIPFVWKEEGTGCENLPKAHTIVKFYRAMLDYVKPGLLMLAEACQPPHDVVEYFGNEDECHAGYHFPLMPRIFISMAAHDRWPIMEMLDHKFTPPIPASCQWFTFLRCHDELTLEMVSEEERVFMNENYLLKPEWIFREGEGISARLADLLQQDPRRIGLAYSIMLTLPGTPIIYYGDEFGRRNDKAYFEEMKEKIGYGDSRFFVRGKLDWEAIEKVLGDPESFESQVNAIIKNLVLTRKQHPAFGRGSLEWIDAGTKEVLAYVREHEGDKVVVVQNLSDSAVSAVVSGVEAGTDLLGQSVEVGADGTIVLSPYAYRWITC